MKVQLLQYTLALLLSQLAASSTEHDGGGEVVVTALGDITEDQLSLDAPMDKDALEEEEEDLTVGTSSCESFDNCTDVAAADASSNKALLLAEESDEAEEDEDFGEDGEDEEDDEYYDDEDDGEWEEDEEEYDEEDAGEYEDEEYDDEEYETEEEVDNVRYNAALTPFNDFPVAGVNLAKFGQEPTFELFEDFDISEFIQGDEGWGDLVGYRRQLQRPSLSFYVDKVAQKRWLPYQGWNRPEIHALFYADELSAADVDGRTKEILELVPTDSAFAAKPTHKSLAEGNWLVDHQLYGGNTLTSRTAAEVVPGDFNSLECARELAQGLEESCDDSESWALKNVKPGFVIEQRWGADDNLNEPPNEFNIFTIWGRVWVAQWNYVDGQDRHYTGFVHRNGTVASGYVGEGGQIPDWLPWNDLVETAEELGANKDMFRTDIFLGRPVTGDSSVDYDEDATLQAAISEFEICPTTVFNSEELTGEGARLWIAGYKMGIYQTVPNTEVPQEFLETGMLPLAE